MPRRDDKHNEEKITPPPRNAFSEMTKNTGKKLPRTRDAFLEMTKITKKIIFC